MRIEAKLIWLVEDPSATHYLMCPCLIARLLLSGVGDKQKPRCLPLLVAQTLRLLSSRDYIDEVHYLTYRCDHFLLSSPLLRLHCLTCLYVLQLSHSRNTSLKLHGILAGSDEFLLSLDTLAHFNWHDSFSGRVNIDPFPILTALIRSVFYFYEERIKLWWH